MVLQLDDENTMDRLCDNNEVLEGIKLKQALIFKIRESYLKYQSHLMRTEGLENLKHEGHFESREVEGKTRNLPVQLVEMNGREEFTKDESEKKITKR